MSSERNIFCTFADDIRHEVNGKISLIGMYQGGMNIGSSLPVVLPQLVITAYINTPVDHPFKDISIDLLLNDQVLQNLSPPPEAVQDMQDSTPQFSDARMITMMMVLKLQPFDVTEEGRLFVRAKLDGAVLEGNALRIRVAEPIPDPS